MDEALLSKVTPVLQDLQDCLGQKGHLDWQGHRGCQVQLVFLVIQGEMDSLVLMAQQDVKEREVFQANQVHEEYRDLLVLMAYKAHLGLLAQLLLLMDSL